MNGGMHTKSRLCAARCKMRSECNFLLLTGQGSKTGKKFKGATAMALSAPNL